MQVIIFDDKRFNNFFPISHTRSVGDLRCGILKLRQRLQFVFDSDDSMVIIEPRLYALYRERHPDWQINVCPDGQKLYLNSRIKLDYEAITEIKNLSPETALIQGDDIVACMSSTSFGFGDPIPEGLSTTAAQTLLYNYISDLVHDNARLIEWDFQNVFYEAENYFETEPGVTVLNPYNIWVAEEVTLAPNVVLDASSGPIVLDTGAKVMASSVITGPAYIGKKSLVKIGAKIYGGVSIGPLCKVGGEIEGSVFQAYSNKQHDGFLGHAYIGEWVNLGADTNNSDLKNTYKNVKTYIYPERRQIDSGNRFMGCILGDHVKTGINCSMNTGLVVGTGSNIYGSKLFSSFVADYSWGEADNLCEYRFPDFIQTASIVKSRRGLGMTKAEMELLKTLMENKCK
ncbi:MAG: putative sugar nucleotidyl transferase, partial [Candidatus Cloacimonetes bacterium]|nr:putative sugar nucleotidyl transferase [Candidatus Cloacimonadota bacterium]